MGLRSWRLIDLNRQLFVVAHDVCGELLEQLQADLTRRVHLDKLEDAEAALGEVGRELREQVVAEAHVLLLAPLELDVDLDALAALEELLGRAQAHAVVADAEDRDVADAGDPFDRVGQLQCREVLQKERIELLARRVDGDEEGQGQEVWEGHR